MNKLLDGYDSMAVRRDTFHTVSLVEPWVADGDAVCDVGCGEGFVLWELGRRRRLSQALGVDIIDARKVPVPGYLLASGRQLPVADGSFNVVMLIFVLHHVPDELKDEVLAEARRISRKHLLILEDTPINWLDRIVSRRHGLKFQRRVGSNTPFGFLSKDQWEARFHRLGFTLEQSDRVGRFARNWRQPYARSVFVLS